MDLGPIELVVILVALVALAICIWGIADAASRPDEAWRAAGQNKVLWIVLQAVGLFVCWIGFILTVVYFTTIRPKVRAAQA